jgi:hypothetical protein
MKTNKKKTGTKKTSIKKPFAKKVIQTKKQKPKSAVKKISKQTVENYPHFRRYKKSKNHPALITGEHSEQEYKFRKVMHAERDGKRLNEKVSPNPDITDNRPMFIGKSTKHDKKKYFGQKLSWKYPNKKQ